MYISFKYQPYSVFQKVLMYFARNFQKEVWGKKQSWAEYLWTILQYKKYDEIDYKHGPSQSYLSLKQIKQ